jgi:hypothetical protein
MGNKISGIGPYLDFLPATFLRELGIQEARNTGATSRPDENSQETAT